MGESGTTTRPGQVILSWWSVALGDRSSGAQKGLSARLRRADDVAVLCEAPVHDLATRLNLRDGARIAGLARLLAHIRQHGTPSLPRLLGEGDPPKMSRLRFERLMHARGADLEAGLRRALMMTGYAANVAHLGESYLFWADATRMRWCFDYFGTIAPQPKMIEETSQ